MNVELNVWGLVGIIVGCVVGGLVIGFLVSRWYFKKQLKEHPPITEKQIRAMFRSMGRNPSEKQVREIMRQMNNDN